MNTIDFCFKTLHIVSYIIEFIVIKLINHLIYIIKQ